MPRILTPAEFRAQPWKNGRGITHEIVRRPDDDAFDVRVSLAEDREPGPFSRFPGHRRWSFLAGPAPIVLEVEGTAHELRGLGDHVELPGDRAIECTLPAGPTRLLTVLVRDGLDAMVGHGACASPIWFVFALAPLPWLSAGCAAVFEPPAIVSLPERGGVWVAS